MKFITWLKRLFNNKWFGQFLTSLNAFPVDRENPGPSTLKRPVNLLKKIKLLVSSIVRTLKEYITMLEK